MSRTTRILSGTALAAVAAVAAHAQQAPSGGTATYWMSAETASGMSAMGQARGSYAHNLTLQLGTGQRAAGAPSAEHLPPATLKAGTALPLVSPMRAPAAAAQTPYSYTGEKPKGRMLFYWGCGERARPGQPVIVDFASLASGKVPPAFAQAALKAMTPPSAARHASYGEWPNDRSKTRVPAGGSLVGDHLVRGNYTPEIKFALAPGQDFLPPVALTAQNPAASGSVPLAWKPMAASRGWFLSTAGAAGNGDIIMWTSSEKQAAAMMMDYLAPEEIAKLVAQKVLLPGTADRCTVPQEVAKAAPQSMLAMVAFGPEANFTHPIRPAKAAASWKPEWAAKLRTKSTYMGMLGMDMAAMMNGSDDGDDAQDEAPRPETKKDKIRRGIGRLLGN
ncbi:MAG TPA: hypothetical protein VGB70_08795 [Allosphingosinicella sp.]|jgi:hypothetical protein